MPDATIQNNTDEKSLVTKKTIAFLESINDIEGDINASTLENEIHFVAWIKASDFSPLTKLYITICHSKKTVSVSLPIIEQISYVYRLLVINYINKVNCLITGNGKLVLRDSGTVYYEQEHIVRDEKFSIIDEGLHDVVNAAISLLKRHYKSIDALNYGVLSPDEKYMFLNQVKCCLQNI